MNFVGHVQVARAISAGQADTSGLAFGAALPDLTSMARLRLDQSALPPALREGVGIHHRTDRFFHAETAFSNGAHRITAELTARGLAKGAARAVGHAGFELLLDGSLLAEPGTEEDFLAVMDGAPDLAAAIPPADAGNWRRLLAALRDDRWWLGYGDPALVAVILQRRLRSRRLLAFDDGHLEDVTAALASALPVVATEATALVASVVAALQAEGPATA